MTTMDDDYNVDYGQDQSDQLVFGSGTYASQPPGQSSQGFGGSNGGGQVIGRGKIAYTKPKPNYDLFKPHEDRSAPLYKGRRITVYRNGDAFYRGLTVCVSQRLFPTFASLLQYIDSKKLLLNRPCNKLYDMDGRVMRATEELQEGGEYVAATRDFIDVDYGDGTLESGWKITKKLQKRDEPRSVYINEREAINNPASMPGQFKAKPLSRNIFETYQEPPSYYSGDDDGGGGGGVPYYLRGSIDRRPPPPNVSRKLLSAWSRQRSRTSSRSYGDADDSYGGGRYEPTDNRTSYGGGRSY